MRYRKKKRLKITEKSIRHVWDIVKRSKVRVTGVPEGEVISGADAVFEEITDENFPKAPSHRFTRHYSAHPE